MKAYVPIINQIKSYLCYDISMHSQVKSSPVYEKYFLLKN